MLKTGFEIYFGEIPCFAGGNRIDYFLSYKCVNEKMDESSREI